MANSRGGLSKREYSAKQAGKPMPYALKGSKSTVLPVTSAKKAASTSVSKDLVKAQKEYLSSLNPSKEEESATASLGKINQQAETERAAIVDPVKNPVASSFVQNQTAALTDRTENAVIPLKYQIAALQSQREARGNIAKTKLSFAKTPATKAVDPLDTEYKKLRNENLKKTIAKKGKGGGGGSDLKAYKAIKSENTASGLVTLPKGQQGPPAPKVLIQQNAVASKELAKAQKKREALKSALLKK